MRASTRACGPKLELSPFCLRHCDKLPDRSDPRRFTCHQHVGLAGEWSDRDEIVQRVIWQVLHDCGAVGMSACIHEQRVTVGRGLRGQSGGRCTFRAGNVLDCHGLAPQLRELRADGAGYHIRPATSPERLDHAHRLRWIVLQHQSQGQKNTEAGVDAPLTTDILRSRLSPFIVGAIQLGFSATNTNRDRRSSFARRDAMERNSCCVAYAWSPSICRNAWAWDSRASFLLSAISAIFRVTFSVDTTRKPH